MTARMPHDEQTDAPTADGLDVTHADGVVKGNADIVCERGTPQPDGAFTLPIYPKPSDFYS